MSEKDTKLMDLIRPLPIKNKEGKVIASIGFIKPIHQKGVKKFQVEITEFELELIIKHWIERLKTIDGAFNVGISGSYEIRMYPYANSRLNYLEPFLTEKAIKELWKQ